MVPWPSVVPVSMPMTVLECQCTISVAVAKTHDCCVVTLAQKNMIMGTVKKEDRIKLHGFSGHDHRRLPLEAQRINVNLTRVSRHLKADIGLIDGTVGMQGNGPGGGFEIDLGISIASADVFAADAAMAFAMGFEPLEIGLLYYADREDLGVADLDRIAVDGPALASVQRGVQPHDAIDLQLQWFTQAQFGAFYAAKDLGFYEAHITHTLVNLQNISELHVSTNRRSVHHIFPHISCPRAQSSTLAPFRPSQASLLGCRYQLSAFAASRVVGL